jgi:thymidylate synthase (FAD)
MADVRIITEPAVRLISRQSIDGDALADFLAEEAGAPGWASDAQTDADAIPEVAGRLCYLSYKSPRPGGNAAYISHVIGSGHGRVTEHSVFGLLTHKAGWAHSELSQRFVDCSDVAFVVPPALAPALPAWRVAELSHPLYEAWYEFDHCCKDALRMYGKMVDALASSAPAGLAGTDRRKWARQAARSVLPLCTETKVYVTANVRAIRHFVELRGSPHADAEIRRLALVILSVMRREAPALFADYEVVDVAGVGPTVSTKHRKV